MLDVGIGSSHPLCISSHQHPRDTGPFASMGLLVSPGDVQGAVDMPRACPGVYGCISVCLCVHIPAHMFIWQSGQCSEITGHPIMLVGMVHPSSL